MYIFLRAVKAHSKLAQISTKLLQSICVLVSKEHEHQHTTYRYCMFISLPAHHISVLPPHAFRSHTWPLGSYTTACIGLSQDAQSIRWSSSRSSNGSSSSGGSGRHNKRKKKATSSGTNKAWTASLDACLQAAVTAESPCQLFQATYSLGKCVQQSSGKSRYTSQEREELAHMVSVLAAKLLGVQAPTPTVSSSSSSSSSSHTAAPVYQLDSKQLSLSLWALSQLMGAGSKGKSRQLKQLVDVIAEHVVSSNVIKEHAAGACTDWSMILYGVARMGFRCRDSQAVRRLFDAYAQLMPQMLHRRQKCMPQDVSNVLWAFASVSYPGSLCRLTPAIASNMQRLMADAKPQALSSTLWALATLKMKPGTSTLNMLVTALVEKSSEAKPQALSNTLWALATLNMHPGTSTLNKLATALAEKSSDAQPQELANAMWALGQLDHYQARAIQVLATTMAQHGKICAAKPQEISKTLQGLGSLRWYDATTFNRMVSVLVQKISSSTPEEAGRQFSNAIFSCALSSHFDSSVDALAAWASQQNLHLWTEQEVSNTLFAWAILSATARGDTTNMRKLARALFIEASRRGSSSFTVTNDLGKLHSAHMEAQHLSLPGGGLTDAELQLNAAEATSVKQQHISKELGHIAEVVAAAPQENYEVQAAMVRGYRTLLVAHPSCPRGIAVAVTQHYRDYLRHPAGQLYGKIALRLEQVKRGCDGLVLCDASELKGSTEQQCSMLLQRLNVAVQNKQVH